MGKRENVRKKVWCLQDKVGTLMGRLDGVLEKAGAYRTPTLEALLHRVICRLPSAKKKQLLRCSLVQNEIVHFLHCGDHENALHQADCALKEQDMFYVFVMLEIYCNLLMERAQLLEHHRQCPDELREAIAGIFFAESRCRGVPELGNVCSVLGAKLGKDFAMSIVELRSGCGVNAKMIQKLSNTESSLESRLKLIKDIASEKGISIDLERYLTEKMHKACQDDNLSESMDIKHKYEGAASPAQVAPKLESFASQMSSSSESESNYLDDRSDSMSDGLNHWKDKEDGGRESTNCQRTHCFQSSSYKSKDEKMNLERKSTENPQISLSVLSFDSTILVEENGWLTIDPGSNKGTASKMETGCGDAGAEEWAPETAELAEVHNLIAVLEGNKTDKNETKKTSDKYISTMESLQESGAETEMHFPKKLSRSGYLSIDTTEKVDGQRLNSVKIHRSVRTRRSGRNNEADT